MFHRLRIFMLAAIDAILLNLAFFSSLLIRFDGDIPVQYFNAFVRYNLVFTGILLVFFVIFGMYRRSWRYASIGELVAISAAVTGGTLVNAAMTFFLNGQQFPLPRSVYILAWIITVVLVGTSRLAWRLVRDYGFNSGSGSDSSARRVIVIGAGDAGVMVMKELKNHYNGRVQIVGFIDDDPHKQNMIIQGITVLGTRADIIQLVEKHQINELIIAMPSAEGREIREIVCVCKDTKAKVKILPGVFDLIDGKVKVSKIR
ncbi:MAG: polysaccharide biosynthesis protein, partial [Desulfitobacteriaceae bacterium]|nr:polysaccharide biosynthesis protein [Desulfitobacteriaceae bacterium]